MEQRVAPKPERSEGPQRDACRRPRGTGQHRDTDQKEDQSDIAQEVLVERAGGGYTRHCEIPVGG